MSSLILPNKIKCFIQNPCIINDSEEFGSSCLNVFPWELEFKVKH